MVCSDPKLRSRFGLLGSGVTPRMMHVIASTSKLVRIILPGCSVGFLRCAGRWSQKGSGFDAVSCRGQTFIIQVRSANIIINAESLLLGTKESTQTVLTSECFLPRICDRVIKGDQASDQSGANSRPQHRGNCTNDQDHDNDNIDRGTRHGCKHGRRMAKAQSIYHGFENDMPLLKMERGLGIPMRYES